MAGLILALAALGAAPAAGQTADHTGGDPRFTRDFFFEDCTFRSRGTNPYFILEPGYRLLLTGKDEGEQVDLVITVLDETVEILGVETRVVEERESVDGELFEVSRNFFAICEETNSVVYWGEDVDFYEDGQIVRHEGAWRAGRGAARPGIIMPGTVLLGARYFQEVAPEVALDQAEIVSLHAPVKTPLGDFEALKVRETTPLEQDALEFKYHVRGIGLVKDGPVRLVQAGFAN